MEASVVKEETTLENPQPQEKSDVLEEKKETETRTESEGMEKAEDGNTKVTEAKDDDDDDTLQYGDPNRCQEIRKTFDELTETLSELEGALNIIDKPPEVFLVEITKNTQKDLERLQGLDIKDFVNKEILEEASSISAPSIKRSSRAELNVVVSNKDGDTTESIVAGAVVEPQPIEVKNEEEGIVNKPHLQDLETEKGSEIVTSKDSSRETTEEAKDNSQEATEKAKDNSQEATEEAKDNSKETTEKAKDNSKETTEEAKDNSQEATEKAKDNSQEATEKAKDNSKETTKEAKDSSKETTEKAKDNSKETTEEAKDNSKETTEEAKDNGKETTEEAKDNGKETTEEAKDNGKETTEEAKDSSQETTEEAKDSSQETTKEVSSKDT